MTSPKTLSPEECEAIQARVEAATPGEWEVFSPTSTNPGIQAACGERIVIYGDGEEEDGYFRPGIGGRQVDGEALANATFIAASRTDIPNLLHTIAELRKEVARLEKIEHAAGRLLANASGHYMSAEDMWVLNSPINISPKEDTNG